MGNELRDKYAAQKRYEAQNVIKVLVRLNKRTDKDIIEYLDVNKPLSTQLKHLIRKGINNQI